MDVTIAKFSSGSPSIVRWVHGHMEFALNGRDLAQDAQRAIEAELRQRWTQYWHDCTEKAAVVINAANCDDMMDTIQRPSEYYACPLEIAARALWPTSKKTTSPRVIEAAKS